MEQPFKKKAPTIQFNSTDEKKSLNQKHKNSIKLHGNNGLRVRFAAGGVSHF